MRYSVLKVTRLDERRQNKGTAKQLIGKEQAALGAGTREVSKARSGLNTRVQGCDTEDHRNLGVSNTEKNENGG